MELHVTRSPALPALAPSRPRRLDPGLRALVDAGFELLGDHVVLARHAPTAPPWRQSIFNSAAYYEGSVNHVHVARELTSWSGRRNVVGQAIAYADTLAAALAAAYVARRFDIWVIPDEDDCVVRFHERRDEDGWEIVLDDERPWLGVHVG